MNMKSGLFLLAGVILASLVLACSEPTDPTVTGVTVNPKNVNVAKGDTRQFRATVTGENNPAQTVEWEVTGGAAGTAIDANGKLTVDANETAETLTVKATSTADTSKSGTATVTVTGGHSGGDTTTVNITGIAQVGHTLSVDIEGPADNVSYQWTRGDTAEADGAPISGATSSTYLLTENDEGKFIKVIVTVNGSSAGVTSPATKQVLSASAPTPTVTAVTVSPATISLEKGESRVFKVTVTGENDPDTRVIWTVTGGADSGTFITIDGSLTVAEGETATTLTVKAVSTADDSKFGTAAVTVTGGTPVDPGTPATVTAVTVSPSTTSVDKGATRQFSAAVTGTNGPAQTVTWAVTGGITGTSITPNGGLLTVAAGETATSLTVRATSTADTAKSGTATVTVTAPPLPALTGTVSISGTAKVLETLTANTASLGGTGGTIGYQWARGDTATGTFSNISGATSATYTLAMADLTKFIRVTVTRTGYTGNVISTASGPVKEAADSTKLLTSVSGASSIVTDSSRTDIVKIDMSVLKTNWSVVQYSLAAYKGKEIKLTLSVDVKREGAAGDLKWQINNDADDSPKYPSVASLSNAAVNTWHTITGDWTGTPNNANPALYLNNDGATGTTFYYIDNFTVTISDPNTEVSGGDFNGVTWTNADLGASSFQKTAKNGPYDVEMWNENRQGTASMTLGVDGAYKCSWKGIDNVLFRAGRKYNETQTHSQIGTFTIEYDATFNPGTVSGSKNSYLSVYGWLTGSSAASPEDLIEYYIIEAKGEYSPGVAGTQVGEAVTIDGGTYTIHKVTRASNAESIKGQRSFVQYFSIRTSNRTSGTISVTEHFKAWEAAGLTAITSGKLYEVSFKVESFGGKDGKSEGNAEVTTNILRVNGTEIQ